MSGKGRRGRGRGKERRKYSMEGNAEKNNWIKE